ncbi:alanine racemase [candidate division KSB1 bacterium]|nr:alanine racemase [candidate division KSB1 bacterium]
MKNNNTNSLSPPAIPKEYEDPWNKLLIDLDALKSNYKYLKSKLPRDTILYAVLKSDAYGHGIKEVGISLTEVGCTHFAVETPQEGISLRIENINGEILVMNPIPEWMAELAVRNDLSVTVIHQSILPYLEDAAKQMGKECKIHLNVNVGLNRMGIAPSKVVKIAEQANKQPHLILQGIYGQPRDPISARESYSKLNTIAKKLNKKQIYPKCLHFANSTTFLAQPETIADGVRLGILLYGVLPPEQYNDGRIHTPLKPVMSLKTELVQIRHLEKGSRLGYHSAGRLKRDSVIGTIPLGYYHGLDRKITKAGYVLIKDQKAPFIGSISMNAAMIDITDIPNVKIGDEGMIVGRENGFYTSMNEIAQKSGTIAAELMTRFGKSIGRIYETNNDDISTEITVDQKSIKDDININYYQTEKELPDPINFYDIVNFLKMHLKPYSDTEEIINTAVDYALSADPRGKGFVILATINDKIIGTIVSIKIDKMGIMPEYMFVYVCIHQKYRGKGITTRLIEEAVGCAGGNIKLHLAKSDPKVKLFKKLGFNNNYLELRLIRGEK